MSVEVISAGGEEVRSLRVQIERLEEDLKTLQNNLAAEHQRQNSNQRQNNNQRQNSKRMSRRGSAREEAV